VLEKQRANSLTPTLRVVQNLLKKRKAGVLSYFISNKASFVLLIDAKHAEIIKLNAEFNDITTAIDSLLNPFHRVNSDSILNITFNTEIAHRLFRYLIEPLEDKLTHYKELLIIPDQALIGLPFEMLLNKIPIKSEHLSTNFSDYSNNFLLNHYNIMYLPNTTFLQKIESSITKEPSILGYAYPLPNIQYQVNLPVSTQLAIPWCFDPLPFAEIEVERINNIHPNTQISIGKLGINDNIIDELKKHQILHFATHSFIDTTFDAFSGLVLTKKPNTNNDGLLMGYEISDHNFNCNLVTLSACQTGCGKIVAGEGVLGLSRSFLSSGAQTVLMTLWKVDDKFTSELMPKFYNHFLNKKKSKSKSLRDAKIEMINESSQNNRYKHPFFWASFYLYGEPELEKDLVILSKEIIIGFILIFIITSFLIYPLCYKRRKNNH